ncbi:MAG: hypothetical protein RBT15_08080 [Gudongella sp.]|jgi:hypothetical protein|nr:hypothetical protein [Gudongella sp.]
MDRFDIDKISIQEMSKSDMILIIEALEYTGKATKINQFFQLRDSILEELSNITEVTKEELLDYLREEALSN